MLSPKLTVAEYYDTLVSHNSWTKLLWKFLFDSKISLFSRMQRENRGGVRLETPVAEVIPPEQDNSGVGIVDNAAAEKLV